MKIGLDIHGVIDRYPYIFHILSNLWVEEGNEVHIVTGQEWETVKHKVDTHGIRYTHHFSIVDHHKEAGTHMWTRDDKDGWWMDREIWLKSKGEYAHEALLDLHFDDQLEYAEYLPSHCSFVLVRDGFELMAELFKMK